MTRIDPESENIKARHGGESKTVPLTSLLIHNPLQYHLQTGVVQARTHALRYSPASPGSRKSIPCHSHHSHTSQSLFQADLSRATGQFAWPVIMTK